MLLMVRMFVVTSSPTLPSPLVEPRTRTPSSYTRAMPRPSILSSTMYSTDSSPSHFLTRASNSLSSSAE